MDDSLALLDILTAIGVSRSGFLVLSTYVMHVSRLGVALMTLHVALPIVTIFSSRRGLQFAQTMFRITPPLMLPSAGETDTALVISEMVVELDKIASLDCLSLIV